MFDNNRERGKEREVKQMVEKNKTQSLYDVHFAREISYVPKKI